MSKHDKDPDFQQRERLRALIEEIWHEDRLSDGLVLPSLEVMEYWHSVLRAGASDAGHCQKPRRTLQACTRFKKNLQTPFDSVTELEPITLAIAEFMVDLDQIQPFDACWPSMEMLTLYLSCKFAGCLPPRPIDDGEWTDALRHGRQEASRAVRLTPLAGLLGEHINDAMSTAELPKKMGDSSPFGTRSFTARKARRRVISRYMTASLARSND